MLTTVRHNLKHVFLAVDQFLNVIVCSIILPWEKHYADETFSSHCWRWHLRGYPWPRRIVDTLLFFDKNHCEESFHSERLQKQMPPECRG